MQEKLKEIVRAAVDGGWLKAFNKCKSVEVVVYDSGKSFRVNGYNKESPSRASIPSLRSRPLSISDLFSSHPFMKSLLGEKTYWEETSDEYGLGTCYDTGIPAYIHHIQQCFMFPTDKERVEYVYRVWKEGNK